MTQQDALEQIIASLNEAMLDDAQWLATSALIDEACGAEGNMLVFGDEPHRDDIEIFLARLCYRGVRDRKGEREYFRIYHRVDERLPRLRRLPDSQIVRIADLFTEEELKNSATYNEVMARGHYQKGLNVRLDGPAGSRIVFAMADPVEQGDWSSDQIEMVRRILPHLRQYVRVRSALADAEALRTTTMDLLGNRRAGVIHLNRHGRIVEANDPARDLLRSGNGLSDEGGSLQACLSGENAGLQRLVARALPRFGVHGTSGSMMVGRSPGLPMLVVHVRPVSKREVDVRSRRVAALVLVIDPAGVARIEPNLVETVLGLTPTESQIAVLFAQGRTLRQIASATGRGIGTIRWHMKRILNKQGISRQVDLVQRVLALGSIPTPRN